MFEVIGSSIDDKENEKLFSNQDSVKIIGNLLKVAKKKRNISHHNC